MEVKTQNGLFRRGMVVNENDTKNQNVDDEKLVNICNLDNNTLYSNTKFPKSCNVENNIPKRMPTKFTKRSIIFQTLIYVILMLPIVLASKQLNITQFDHHPGLYFDGIGKTSIVTEKWHIITFFNLSNHWDQFFVLSKSLESIKVLCNTSSCVASIKEIETQLTQIKMFDEIIKSECQLRELVATEHIRRQRRSAIFAPLNVLGNIANKLTGVLDNEYAEKMEKVITNIKLNGEATISLKTAYINI